MPEEQKLLPVEEAPKLLDRPAEERLREELDRKNRPPAPGPRGEDHAAERPKPSRRALFIVLLIALVLLALIFLVGLLPRLRRDRATQTAAHREKTALPIVNVTHVKRSPGTSHLVLPGNITPLTEAPIYARATGYIVKRYVDIGDRVRANQLLASIEAPDLDQQVAQGRAALAQARQQLGQSEAALEQAQAQLALAKVTWDRYAALVTRGAVARQDADQQKANYETSGAVVHSSEANVRAARDNVTASQANVERLIALQSYKEVRSPFAGVVTARNVDVGTYISASGGQSGGTTYGAATSLGGSGSSGGSSQNGEMFRVAQIDRLRILINVPQTDASSVKAGQTADVLLPEYPGRRFPGRVTRTASSLDTTSRTLLTEVQIDNSKHELLPGMYAEIQFASSRSSPPLLVPGDSLITRSEGVLIAILRDPDSQKLQRQDHQDDGEKERKEKPKQIHLATVKVGRDYGTDTEIIAGLQGWEYVVTSPGDDVFEGALVLPAKAPSEQSATPSGGSTDRKPTGGGMTSAGGAKTGNLGQPPK